MLISLKRTFPTEPEMLTPMSGYSYSQILVNLSNRFVYMNRLEHALEAIRDAVDLLRQLAADRPDTFNPDLAGSLNSLSNHLSNLGHRERALEVIQEAVDLRRQNSQQTVLTSSIPISQ
jgi:tetratricopeptide (TPR) repeat protein